MGLDLASVYQYIYLLFITLLTIVYLSRNKSELRPRNQKTVSHSIEELILVVLVILFIGLRPISGYFSDMVVYQHYLQKSLGEYFVFTWNTDNIVFDNLINWWGSKGFNPVLFYLLVATIYFGCAYVGIKRLFNKYAFLAYLVFLAALSTFSYGTNGIKAGAAASIFIMALGYLDRLSICLPLLLLSYGFHHSMVMPIVAFIATLILKKPKVFYITWFVCLIMAFFHVTYFQFLFGDLADEQGAAYLLATEQTTEAHIRFRPDFVLYSSIPVIIGYIYEVRRKLHLTKTYSVLIHFYLVSNSIWMLCMYASFTNRIAYLSWFVYPIVIIYPFLDKGNIDPKRFYKLKKTVIYHLLFTIFMVVIYYGILSLGN